MVESVEFPHLAHRYNVFSVPKTIVNERVHIEGALPESVFVERVLEGISSPIPGGESDTT